MKSGRYSLLSGNGRSERWLWMVNQKGEAMSGLGLGMAVFGVAWSYPAVRILGRIGLRGAPAAMVLTVWIAFGWSLMILLWAVLTADAPK